MRHYGSVVMTQERRFTAAEAYSAHAPQATRLAYFLVGDPQTAEDLVQDAFVQVLGRWGSLRKPESFRSYLNRTVVNLVRKHFRRRHLERTFLRQERSQAGNVQQGLPDVSERNELWNALQQLPHRQRTAVVLRYHMDMSEQQTADAMDCSPNAVNSMVTRALRTLRGVVGSDQGETP